MSTMEFEHEQRAVDLFKKAEKKYSSKSFFSFNSNSKYEEAGELYTQSGNSFKVAQKFQQAGEAYEKAADCHMKLKSLLDASSSLTDAAGCYKKTSPHDAIRCLQRAIEIYMEQGRFATCAKQHKDIAELHEKEFDFENAMVHYQRAADMYSGENQVSNYNTCALKVAQYAAEHKKDYAKAMEIYEKIGGDCVDNNLLKYSARNYFFLAGLCRLCTCDVMEAEEKINRYKDIDLSFPRSREAQLLDDLVAALKNNDTEAFSNAVFNYDNISKLDNFKITLCMAIKDRVGTAAASGGTGFDDEDLM